MSENQLSLVKFATENKKGGKILTSQYIMQFCVLWIRDFHFMDSALIKPERVEQYSNQCAKDNRATIDT